MSRDYGVTEDVQADWESTATEHTHTHFMEGCFRCELSRDEAMFQPDGYNARAGIAERVKAAREMRGWTRTELAERSSLSKSAISRLEAAKGDTLAIHLYRIAQALGVSIAALVGDPEPWAAGEPMRPCSRCNGSGSEPSPHCGHVTVMGGTCPDDCCSHNLAAAERYSDVPPAVRRDARSIPCPECGADRGTYCQGMGGGFHWARLSAVQS